MKPTTEQLVAASEHLVYEVVMYRACCLSIPVQVNKMAKNAVLESFLLHARNVLAFFLDKQKNNDDVLAIHFIEPTKWEPLTKKWYDPTIINRDRINKDLTHLTYDRQNRTTKTKVWECTRIAKKLDDLLTDFLSLIPEALLHSKWKGATGKFAYPTNVTGCTTMSTVSTYLHPK